MADPDGEKPRKVTVDGNTVEAHSIKDQIEADRYNRAKKASGNPFNKLSRVQIRPSDARGTNG